MIDEWTLSTGATSLNGVPMLWHEKPGEHSEACVIRIGDRCECWICGTSPPQEILDVALLAGCMLLVYDEDYIEQARRTRSE